MVCRSLLPGTVECTKSGVLPCYHLRRSWAVLDAILKLFRVGQNDLLKPLLDDLDLDEGSNMTIVSIALQ